MIKDNTELRIQQVLSVSLSMILTVKILTVKEIKTIFKQTEHTMIKATENEIELYGGFLKLSLEEEKAKIKSILAKNLKIMLDAKKEQENIENDKKEE